MTLKTVDMENCFQKKRCTFGENVGLAYLPGDECETGFFFDPTICDCLGDYFYEVAWYKLEEEFQRAPGNACQDAYTYYTTGGKLIGAVNSGLTDQVDRGISWRIDDIGGLCSLTGPGACSTIGGHNYDGYVLGTDGTTEIAGTFFLDRASCIGNNDTLRQTIYTTGVVIGYGATLNDAMCDAKDQEPLLNIYPTC